MIYTSYYSNYRNFPDNFEPVSVSLYPPKGFNGIIIEELAPTNSILMDFKNGKINEFNYIQRYYTEVLSKLNPHQIAKKLNNKILLCFEKKGDFCHRHIITEWLKKHGYQIEELNNSKESPVKIAVVGSRNFNDYKTAFKLLDRLSSKYNKNIKIISGGARGADKIAEKYAQYRGIEIEIFPADWKKYGKSAGYKRNIEIWNRADLGIAFWKDWTKGTMQSFQISFDQNKELYIWNDDVKNFTPRVVKGNILQYKDKYKIIIFTANSVVNENRLIMGAGCAKFFKEEFKNLDLEFGKKIKNLAFFGFETVKKDNVIIGAFQTKIHYQNKSSIELIKKSIEQLKDYIKKNDLQKEKIAMCFPGIGFGGLNKKEVYNLFSGFGNIDFFSLEKF